MNWLIKEKNMFLLICPEKQYYNYTGKLDRLDCELHFGSTGEGFPPLYYFKDEGFWGDVVLVYGNSETFVDSVFLEVEKSFFIENNVSIINLNKDGIHVENASNPLLDICNISIYLKSYLAFSRYEFSKIPESEQSQINDLISQISEKFDDNSIGEIKDQYVSKLSQQSHTIQIDTKKQILNGQLLKNWSNLEVDCINSLILEIIFILKKYNVNYAAKIAELSFHQPRKSSLKLVTDKLIKHSFSNKKNNPTPNDIVLKETVLNKDLDGFPQISLKLIKDSYNVSILRNNVDFNYAVVEYPHPQSFKDFPEVHDIREEIGSLSLFPNPIDVFSKEQPWLNTLFAPVFNIDIGCYKPEWHNLQLPFVIPIVMKFGLENDAKGDGFFDENFIAFQLDDDDKYKLLCEKDDFFSDYSETSKEENEYRQTQLKEIARVKKYFAEHKLLPTNYDGENSRICDIGGHMWTDNWSSVPENYYLFMGSGYHFQNKAGDPVYFIASTDMQSWINGGAPALMFYEPKNRIVLYTFNWS